MRYKNYTVRNVKAAIVRSSIGYLKGKRRTAMGNALLKAAGVATPSVMGVSQ